MASPGSWLIFALRFAFRLCILTLVLEAKFFFMADDDSYVPGVNSISRGNVESELCDNDLSNFMLPPYSNSSSDLVCRPIWNTFYSQTEDHVVNIILSAVYTTGWVGMGFSRNGMMVGSSAIVGWINKKGQVRIKQYYLQGSKVSQVIPDKGELPLTGIPASVVLHGPRIYLAFQMKFKTHLARQPIILAIGSRLMSIFYIIYLTLFLHNHLTIHNDKTTVLFDFSSGSASVGEAPSDLGQMKKNHGILAIFGWGLIIPIGAIVPRYLKHKEPLWYYLHSIIQFVGFVIGLAAVVLGQQLYTKIGANFPTHRGI
ncbi:hypothetical protein D8674_031298 [Pyrus ussuriensis x Pyrus communis]|uniref:Cytochrome b561 and DOMON domain-containing protein n=1 Tax=Pyrus ussuriensis x Pyrus communis TaxID=2448454 RepID=A0A5N5EY48_9ROSA|nr:hypothetical protein D8674_031298 [Pyrus ussuriensis x Pyrus communis]